jgi:DNA repair exonuclease SbcCD ATPase subunit
VKLLRLKVAGFGPLRGEWSFDPDRVTTIVDDNERGKSSLLNAVTAALYGLENDRRTHRLITPLERWRPWDGGAFGVELELEAGGEPITIRRDFERGTVEVWNGRGQEITAQYREGKDEFPVGKMLLGLDVDEFEKCAFVRQGELDQVVPSDEKARRSGTLHARLESATDTRGGDTTASETLRVLEDSLRKYTCPELEFTGTIDNAIQRLEAKRGLLESEAHALDHRLQQAAEPLATLARLSEDESTARTGLRELEQERRRSGATAARRQLREHDERRRELDALKAEADRLSAFAHLPESAEAELRTTLARYDEAVRGRESLEARRRDEQSRERTACEAELASLSMYEACEPADADRLVSLASDLRRFGDEESRLRDGIASERESLAGRGFEPERAQELTLKFGALEEGRLKLLRGQAEIELAFQTEVAELEQTRTRSTELLREIDAKSNGLRLPGWVLTALGISSAIAAGVLTAMRADPRVTMPLIAIAAAMLLPGVGLLLGANASGRQQRQQSLKDLTEAQRRLNQLRSRRAESEAELAKAAASFGYRDYRDLMREWSEYVRLGEESSSLRRVHDQSETLEEHRRATFAEVRERLDRAGGGPPDPAHLERVATGIRHLTALKQRLAQMDKSWSWHDEEKNVAEATVRGLLEKAMRILHTAGLAFDPGRPWDEQVAELSERMKGRGRHALLTSELIPTHERMLLPESRVRELRAELEASEAETGPLPELEGPARSAVEVERETDRLRKALEVAQQQRHDLRLQVDEVCRRYNLEHPEKRLQIAQLDAALVRARRFKRAIELAGATVQEAALDTHRRWADWLNRRVAQILAAFGTQVEELRFGDDLDFSVKVWNGQPLARGKAALQLSAGARDQLWLAIRLAISEFLSKRDDALPLLVDDPFTTSDDDRARAGFKLLIESLSAHHQIVMVTCHRHRLDHLAQLDPEL